MKSRTYKGNPFSYSDFAHQLKETKEGSSLYVKLKAEGRPFEMVNYSMENRSSEISRIFLDIYEEKVKEAHQFIKDFTIPLPADETERANAIKKAANFYKSIGDKITSDLIETMKKESKNGSPSDPEIFDRAINASRSFIFMLLKAENIVDNEAKATFFNDLSMYYHENDPEKEFDKRFKERLKNKVNNAEKLSPYIKMVSADYLENILKEDNTILAKFENILKHDAEKLDKAKFENELDQAKKELIETKAYAEKTLAENSKEIATYKNDLAKVNEKLAKLKEKGVLSSNPKHLKLAKQVSDINNKLRPLDPTQKVTNAENKIKDAEKALKNVEALNVLKQFIDNFNHPQSKTEAELTIVSTEKEIDETIISQPVVKEPVKETASQPVISNPIKQNVMDAAKECIIRQMKGSLNDAQGQALMKNASKQGYTSSRIELYSQLGKEIIDSAFKLDKNKLQPLRQAAMEAWATSCIDMQKTLATDPFYEKFKSDPDYIKNHDELIKASDSKNDFEKLVNFAKNVIAIEKNYKNGRFLNLFKKNPHQEGLNTIYKNLIESIKLYPNMQREEIQVKIVELVKKEQNKLSPTSSLRKHIQNFLNKEAAIPNQERKDREFHNFVNKK